MMDPKADGLREKWQDVKSELSRRWKDITRNEVPKDPVSERKEVSFKQRNEKARSEELLPHRRPL